MESNRSLPVGNDEVRWLAHALKDVSFFSGLTTGQVEAILPAIKLYRFPADTVVIREGERDQGLFILHRGRVVVSRRKWLLRRPVASLLAGDFFGEMALIHERPRSATVTTTEDSELFVLSAKEFRFILERNPALKAALKDVAAERAYALEQWEQA